MNNWKTIIDDYCHYLEFERGTSKYAVNDYRKNLVYLSQRHEFPLTLEMMRSHIGGMNKRNLSKATVNHVITIINSFIRWCQLTHKKQEDFTAILNGMRPHDAKQLDPNDVLTVEQVKNILIAPVRDYDYLDRGKIKHIIKDLPAYYQQVDEMYDLMFELLYKLGARSGEVVKLRKKNINFDHGTISFYETKTGGDRHVPIPPDMEKKILEYVKQLNDSDYLFRQIGKKDKPLSQCMANKMFKKRAELCGINRSVHIHMLRHTSITHLLINGAPLPVVQAIVGHKRLNTTQLYTHILVENQREVLLRFNPLIRSTQDIGLIYKRLKQVLTDMKLSEDPRLQYTIEESNNGLNISIHTLAS